MNYRKFGKLDWKGSALGFGTMRLPVIKDGDQPADPMMQDKVDEPEAIRMLRQAIDQGVNYVDSAYLYHKGHSESVVGMALQEGYRDKVRLATKMPTWLVESPNDFDKYLDEQLRRLQTDHIDFYLLHNLNSRHWPIARDHGVLEWAERRIADGRIGHLGFSFHDQYDVFKEIVDAYDGWTFCQIQYNYMDIKEQAGTKGLKYAAAKGLAVVIMEPLLGGRLVAPPDPVQRIWDSALAKRSPADWGLRWLWNQSEVSVVLSGMSAMAQVKENLASASALGYDVLEESEMPLYQQVRTKYKELSPIRCTRCQYCLPCRNGLQIPWLLNMLNTAVMYDDFVTLRRHYTWVPENQRANQCEKCRECEEKCPQQLPISEWLVRVHEALGEDKSFRPLVEPEPLAIAKSIISDSPDD